MATIDSPQDDFVLTADHLEIMGDEPADIAVLKALQQGESLTCLEISGQIGSIGGDSVVRKSLDALTDRHCIRTDGEKRESFAMHAKGKVLYVIEPSGTAELTKWLEEDDKAKLGTDGTRLSNEKIRRLQQVAMIRILLDSESKRVNAGIVYRTGNCTDRALSSRGGSKTIAGQLRRDGMLWKDDDAWLCTNLGSEAIGTVVDAEIIDESIVTSFAGRNGVTADIDHPIAHTSIAKAKKNAADTMPIAQFVAIGNRMEILRLMGDTTPRSTRLIAEAIDSNGTTVRKHVLALIDRGLIEKTTNPGSGKAQFFVITDDGEDAID